MRRPFALIGFTYLGALLAAVFIGGEASVIIGLFLLLTAILLFCKKSFRAKPSVAIAVLTAGIALTAYFCTDQVKVTPAQILDGQDVTISGVVTELPAEAYNRFYYVVETDSVSLEGAPQKLKVRISSTNYIELAPYDRLTATVRLSVPLGDEEGLNSKNYYASKGIYLTGFVYDYEEYSVSPAESRPFYYYALMGRKALLDSLRSMLPPKQSGLVCGVLLGDKSGISQTVTDDFRTCGVSHLLAVSGMHMAIVGQFFLWLLLLFGIPRRAAAPLSALGVIAFMAVTGFVPSVVRAGIMTILYLIGVGIRSESDALNSLGVASLVLTVGNPQAAGDVGFLLSFSATLGLLLLSPRIQAFLNRWTDKIGVLKKLFRGINSTLATTVSATLFTSPLVALSFGELSIIAPVANLFMSVPATVMLLFGFLASLLYYAGAFAFSAMPMALAAGAIANFLSGCASWLSSWPFASIPVTMEFILTLIVLFSVAAVFLVLWKGKGFSAKLTACTLTFFLLCGTFYYQAGRSGLIEIGILNTGNGSSVVITQNGKAAVLCSGGGNGAYNRLSDYLDKRNIDSLDYLLISQVDKPTSSGASGLIRSYNPGNVLVSNQKQPQERLARVLDNRAGVAYFSEESSTYLWDKVSVHTTAFKNESWIFVEVGQERLLICPAGGDAADVSLKERDCNFYIAGKPPKNAEAIYADYGIYTMYQEEAALAQSVHQTMREQYVTTKQGDVLISVFNDGVKIKTDL